MYTFIVENVVNAGYYYYFIVFIILATRIQGLIQNISYCENYLSCIYNELSPLCRILQYKIKRQMSEVSIRG